MRALLHAIMLFTAAAGTASADVITLRADEWCPYNCAPDNERPGFMIEVAKRVFEPAGHQVEYRVLNWARAIEEARQGKFTGIVGAARGDAEDFVFPAEPLGLSASAFAVRKADKWNYTGIPSLKSRTVGVIRDYSYDEVIDEYIESNKNNAERIQVASGDNALELNLRKLEKGRLDTVVEGHYVLSYALEQSDRAKQFRIAGVSETADPVYIAFSPANPKAQEYAALLARGITALRESGELKAILERYGLRDWK